MVNQMNNRLLRNIIAFLFIINPSLYEAQLPSYLPTNGLVAWYPFNGNANDESGNGNNGVVNGATLTADRFGLTNKAYQFDGIDDFIEVPVQQQNISGYAIMCWFQFPTSPISGDYKALVQASGGYPNSQYSLSLQMSANPLFPNQADNKVSVSINGPGVFNGRISNSTYNDDIWHCLVGVWDAPDGAQTSSSFVKMYLDGASINESATAVDYGSVLTPVSGYGNTLIGMMNHLIGGRYYQGGIDDVAIYNRALTESEVQSLYTNQSTPPANVCTSLPVGLQQGLVGYWPFCGNANDESGNGNDGVVNGATLTEDRFGNANAAYSYDGNSQFIEILNSPSLNPTSISIAGWMNASAFATDVAEGSKAIVTKWYQAVNCTEQGDNYSVLLSIQENENRILGVTSINNAAISAISSSSISLNSWNHFVFVHDENGGDSFFLNGSLINQNSFTGALCPTTNNLIFGADNYFSNYWRFFAGSIDDIGIWNRALTPEEITTLFSATNNNGGGDSNGGSGSVVGNSPPGIPYQAEIRNENGDVLANANVSVRFTLHELAANGTVSYLETHSLTTNELGLFAATIGAGTIGAGSATQGTFAGINWAQTTKFLQVEVDTGNGWITMGNQQLMSVPYAQYSQKARKLETTGLPVFENNEQAIAGGLQAGELYRTSIGDLKVVY